MPSSWVHFLNHTGHLSVRCAFSHVSFLLSQVACIDHPFLFCQEFPDGNKVCCAVGTSSVVSLILWRGVSTAGSCWVLQSPVPDFCFSDGWRASIHQCTQVGLPAAVLWGGGQDCCWSLWMSMAWAGKWWSMALGHCVSLCSPQDAGEMRPPAVQMGVCYLVPRNTGADFAD